MLLQRRCTPLEQVRGKVARRRKIYVVWNPQGLKTYPLLELLVDGIQCILDGDALHVPGVDLKA